MWANFERPASLDAAWAPALSVDLIANPPRHHEGHPLQLAYVGEGIAIDSDDVGGLAGCDRADQFAAVEQFGGADRRGLDRIGIGHAGLDHIAELAGVPAVRTDAHIGAEADLDAGLVGAAQRRLDVLADRERLLRLCA